MPRRRFVYLVGFLIVGAMFFMKLPSSEVISYGRLFCSDKSLIKVDHLSDDHTLDKKVFTPDEKGSFPEDKEFTHAEKNAAPDRKELVFDLQQANPNENSNFDDKNSTPDEKYYSSGVSGDRDATSEGNESLPGKDDMAQGISSAKRTDYTDVDQIVFNRVPKTASSATQKILGLFSQINNFTYVRTTTFHTWHLPDPAKEHELVDDILRTKKPFIYDRHIRFINFSRFDHVQPYFISIVREPLSRLDSMYRMVTLKFKGLMKKYNFPENVTFEECIEGDYYPCANTSSYFVLVPFFCGHDALCSVPSQRSLSVAKQHIENNYILVGIQEAYEAFIEGLEHLIPQYCKGLVRYYSAKGGVYSMRGIGTPVLLNAKNKEKIKARLKEEYELYEFVRQRFYSQAKAWRASANRKI